MIAPTTRKDLMIVNMGPHHPSMHGVLRLIVTLDGEDVIDCEPILGYLHRGMEKILFIYIRTTVGHISLYREIEEAIQGFSQACSYGT